jgi:hypothetical protein
MPTFFQLGELVLQLTNLLKEAISFLFEVPLFVTLPAVTAWGFLALATSSRSWALNRTRTAPSLLPSCAQCPPHYMTVSSMLAGNTYASATCNGEQ